ncbi:MAG: DegV family protein [Erysipelotrichaceae bacterium]|nr:DegV family protein [Erysipelotrichaceae bacterium]
MSIKIIADSASDLNEEVIKKYDIEIIPSYIVFNDRSYKDGIEVKPEDIYRWSDENDQALTTSSPNFMEVADIFNRYLEKYDGIVCIAVSALLSGTYNVFRLAARETGKEERIRVIDSKNLCSAEGLLVIKAKELADEGKDIDEIAKEIDELKERLDSSFVLDTLDYIHRGGRCSDASHLLGMALKVHPKIVVENGVINVAKKYRGRMKKVYREYVDDLHDELVNADKERCFLSDSGLEEDIEDIAVKLKEEYGFKEVLRAKAGCVISCNCGPGTMAVFFFRGK